MAFRTISRLDNRVLAVSSYTREKREREGDEELEEKRGGVLSPALYILSNMGRYLISHLRMNVCV